MILHTINKNPNTHSALSSCLRLASSGSGILFLEDGVYAVLKDKLLTDVMMSKHTFYVLEEDLKARGINSKGQPGFEVISYDKFVALSLEYSKVQSWS